MLPPTRHVRGCDEILRAGEVLGYPLALKPIQEDYRVLGKKCIFLDGANAISDLPVDQIEDLSLLAQPRAAGRRRNVLFAAKGGELSALFECEVLRTDVLDGTGYGVDVVSVDVHPAHRTAVEALVESLSWDGLGCAQFMFDAETRTSQFLEINPRTDANIAICQLSGINLVALAVSDRLGPGGQETARIYSVGRRLHWILGDLDGLREPGVGFLKRFARVRAMVRTFLRANGYVVYRRRDPVPAVYLTYRWVGEAVMGALKGVLFGHRQSH